MSTGEALRAKADKKASGGGGGWSLFGGGSSARWEEAHDLYTQAGNAYRLEKRWKESGDAFVKAAEMALKNQEVDDAANDYWTASKSYKKSHPHRAHLPLTCGFIRWLTKGEQRRWLL